MLFLNTFIFLIRELSDPFLKIVPSTFLGLEHGSCVAVYAVSLSVTLCSVKNILICSEDEQRSYRFGTT